MNKEEIQKLIQSAVNQAAHLKMSPETETRLTKIQSTLDNHIYTEMDDLKKAIEDLQDLKTVIYGNQEKGEVGMNQMVKDMHMKIVQANGVISFMKLILLVGGAGGVLYTLFKRF